MKSIKIITSTLVLLAIGYFGYHIVNSTEVKNLCGQVNIGDAEATVSTLLDGSPVKADRTYNNDGWYISGFMYVCTILTENGVVSSIEQGADGM